ncbi:MAG: hypothetical protein LBG76_02140 [Treponema sp.]|jgi:hypothetical protein|nr:hypothetical protein [Treponema sp.]
MFRLKQLIPVFFALFTAALAACTAKEGSLSLSKDRAEKNQHEELSMDANELIEKELRGCFDYFWNETPAEPGPGYGLTRDNTNPGQRDFASIAAAGFALAVYPAGVEKGWISREAGLERTLETLKTFEALPHYQGFFYHFIQIHNGKPWPGTEVSTIDTALFLAGAFVAAEYFGGQAAELVDRIYRRINWTILLKPNGRFFMAFREKDGAFEPFGEWAEAAEQFILYVFAAGAPVHKVSGDVFYAFSRWSVRSGEHEYIRSYMNSIFVYQYSHAFIDFRGTVDRKGVDWWANSVNAVRAARQYAIDASGQWKTLGPDSWGLSAGLGPKGYQGAYGARPNGMPGGALVDRNDGTVAVYGAVASLPFAPEEAAAALRHYAGYEALWGPYGLSDSFNLDQGEGWFCPHYIGIDKGIEALMIVNYQTGLIWELFNRNRYVKAGLAEIGVTAAR